MNDMVRMELEALQAVYCQEELEIIPNQGANDAQNFVLKIKLCKSATELRQEETASASSSSGFTGGQITTMLTIRVVICETYPSVKPTVKFEQPRGINDSDLRCLEMQIHSHLEANIGHSVIFDIFQIVQDFLDSYDAPELECSICLSPFTSANSAVTTDCGHFFHGCCLGKYLQLHDEDCRFQIGQLPLHMVGSFNAVPPCPVCRASIPDFDFKQLLSMTEVDNSKFQPTDSVDLTPWRLKQKEMTSIFDRQKEKGGIIDPEEETRRMLIDENTWVPVPSSSTIDEPMLTTVEEAAVDPPSATAIDDIKTDKHPSPAGVNHARGGRHHHHARGRRGRGGRFTNHYHHQQMNSGQRHGSTMHTAEGATSNGCDPERGARAPRTNRGFAGRSRRRNAPTTEWNS